MRISLVQGKKFAGPTRTKLVHDKRRFYLHDCRQPTPNSGCRPRFRRVRYARFCFRHLPVHAPRLSGLERRGLKLNLCVRDVMADFQLSAGELRPLVQEVVRAVMDELTEIHHLIHGKLAITEEQAAELLDLNPWQLRDLRLAGKIGFTRIVGNRVRYTVPDLLDYLRRNHRPGKEVR